MAAAILHGLGGRAAPARNVLRPAVARLVAAVDGRMRRRVGFAQLGLDDAGFATALSDRRALERAGQGDLRI